MQEALQNALKHSGAREIIVHLHGVRRRPDLSVIDDGAGFDVSARFGSGLGLVSMNERLEAIGGTLKIRSTPGEGTRLKIRVPLDSHESVKLAG